MELSADQIRERLHALLNPGAGPQPDGTFVGSRNWVREIFPLSAFCIYVDDTEGKIYKQAFTVNGPEIALAGPAEEAYITYGVVGQATPTESQEAPAPAKPNPELSQRARNILKLGMTEHLHAALQEAATAGDVEAAAAIAGWMKKQAGAAEPQNPPAPGEQQPSPLTPENQPGSFYQRCKDQLEAKYPGHSYLAEDATSVTIEYADEDWRIPVSAAEDGTCTLGEAIMVPEETRAQGTPGMVTSPQKAANGQRTGIALSQGHKRALLSAVSPKLLETRNDKGEVWVNIVNLGEYEHPEYGTLNFTKEMFDQWKANLERGVMGGKCEDGSNCVATDYGHAMDEEVPPEQQKASGYIKNLKLDGERVYALVEFTPPAVEGIKNKEWGWFSVSVFDSLTDQKTGEDVGSVLAGGALTNRPFIPDLEPIRLSDLRPSRASKLERELAEKDVQIKRLKRENFDRDVAATLATLERARIPPAVIGLMRPLLEADFEAPATIKLSRSGQTTVLSPGKAAVQALLELAQLGLVQTGEITGLPSPSQVTLEQAAEEVEAEWRKEGKKNYRRKDVYLAARRKYPHLRDN